MLDNRALPTGTISMSQVNVELRRPATQSINLNDAEVRKLAGRASGAISMNDLRGKSNSFSGVLSVRGWEEHISEFEWLYLAGFNRYHGNVTPRGPVAPSNGNITELYCDSLGQAYSGPYGDQWNINIGFDTSVGNVKGYILEFAGKKVTLNKPRGGNKGFWNNTGTVAFDSYINKDLPFTLTAIT